jgi:hypothetical protein
LHFLGCFILNLGMRLAVWVVFVQYGPYQAYSRRCLEIASYSVCFSDGSAMTKLKSHVLCTGDNGSSVASNDDTFHKIQPMQSPYRSFWEHGLFCFQT